jgi:hypothetical protein
LLLAISTGLLWTGAVPRAGEATRVLCFQAFYDRGGKLFSGLKGCEAPNAGQSFKLVVREEVIEPI